QRGERACAATGAAGGGRSVRVSLQGAFSVANRTEKQDRSTEQVRLPRSNKRRQSRETAPGAFPHVPEACPVCNFSFEAFLGQWERNAHVQKCLDEACLDEEFL
ncbi:unnamed protein product, partial [Discosporangium mesarthrocarpum]